MNLAKKGAKKEIIKESPQKITSRKTTSTGRKMATKKVASTGTHSTSKEMPSGYTTRKSGVHVPSELGNIVPKDKKLIGFDSLKSQIKEFTDEVTTSSKSHLRVSEIELSVSFNTEGKFLGIGVGGAASIKVKLIPN